MPEIAHQAAAITTNTTNTANTTTGELRHDARAVTTQDVRLPEDRHLVMRVMPMPNDANNNGDIFGGWIMAQVDLAGAVLPARIAKGRIATVAVNQFVFKQPVSIGDLLSFYAKVERVGTTSVTVNVEVYAERNPANLQVVKVTEANLTYVAISDDGKPRQLPVSAASSAEAADRAPR